MREFITFVGIIIPLIGAVPYLINTVRGKTRPNVVTWFTWTLINGINGAAAFSDGAWQTGLFSLMAFTATASITIAGLRQGIKKYTAFDIACQALALLGIPLWLATSEPAYAVVLVLLVDLIGGLPTLRHAWRAPQEETWQTFALSACGTGLVIASLARYDFVALALPLSIFIFDSLVLSTLLYRRRLQKVTAVAAQSGTIKE